MNHCKTCHKQFMKQASYCQYCGAKQPIKRLTVRSLFQVFFVRFTSLDFAFINTTKWLIINPKFVTKGYIRGVRKLINHPTNYALIVISLYGIFQLIFSDFLDLLTQNNFVSSIQDGFNHSYSEGNDTELGEFDSVFNWLQTRSQFLVFSIIPMLALFCYLFFKKKSKYNLAEHLVIALYAISLSLLINVVIGVFFAPFNTETAVMQYNSITSVTAIVAVVWVYQQSLKGAIWRVILALLLSFFITLTLISIAIMVYIFFSQ